MKTTFLAAAVTLLAVSCTNDPDPIVEYEKTPGSVAKTELIGAARAGVPVQLDVTFSLHNSCSSFDSFESWKEADTLVVKVWGLTPKDSGCTKEIRYHTKRFTYTYPSPGTYYLKFMRFNGNLHRDTLIVTP
ncbi:hypothetical protein [Chitinophaga barathri]|uniref:Lipoprotein n=1 Tax=Chitinophaga barathri TaxID=1647451 RepID=A0A3N4M4X5_9BACT|nr:hypothetical protein [Chitinophaga barathri]RPD38214.1 hypothetical protein EG028_26505 [Chitinophaga barathri]